MSPEQRYTHSDKRDRQYGTLEQIRPDHVRRYLLAANVIPFGSKTLDLACGCGYGSWLLHGAGLDVTSIDISSEALEYARKHYQGPKYIQQRAEDTKGEFDAFVTFETLEHLADPLSLLKNVKAKCLVASVPNEEVTPFKKEKFIGETYPHLRHYTPQEFRGLLMEAGYRVVEMCCQKDKGGYFFPGTDGMFMVAIAYSA